MTLRWLLPLLLAGPVSAATFAVADGRLLVDGQPSFLMGLRYPLAARRDGAEFDADAVVGRLRADGLDFLAITIAEGPTLADAEALLTAADAAGVPVVAEPLSPRDTAAVARLAGHPSLLAWLAPAGAGSTGERPTWRRATGTPEALPAGQLLLGAPPVLFEAGLGFGDFARLLAAQRLAARAPLIAEVPCAPPAWFIATQALPPAAEQVDLYADGRLRPHTVAALAGDYLLVPEPAALRLATYAAAAAGARGILFDHAGHLADGPDPHNGADRAATIARLAGELAPLRGWLAEATAEPLAELPDGVAGALLTRGDDRLVLLFRQRRLDSRVVGGTRTPPFSVTVPWPEDRPASVLQRLPSGVSWPELDRRAGGLRLNVPPLDLTAAYLLTREPVALTPNLGREATWALLVAGRRWAKVDATLRRLESQRRTIGTRDRLRQAADGLVSAAEALEYGYLHSALELADETERLLREAAAAEFETALGDENPLGDPLARLTFATLPEAAEPHRREAVGPLPLGPDAPPIDFERLAEGSIPDRWQATDGFEQTVATLRVVAGAGGQWLRWSPDAAGPGALYLPFGPGESVSVSLRLRRGQGPLGARLIGLARAVGGVPVAGIRIADDGGVGPWPRGETTAALPADAWVTLSLTATDGRISVRLDEAEVATAETAGPFGALVLGTLAPGAPLELDELTVR